MTVATFAVTVAVADSPVTTGPAVVNSSAVPAPGGQTSGSVQRFSRSGSHGNDTSSHDDGTSSTGAARWAKRHSDMAELRLVAHAEINEIPALEKRMEKLSAIQSRRNELQKQRQATVDVPSKDRDDSIKRFHSLLREDAKLSDQSRKIVKDIIGDMPRIKKQLHARQAALKTELKKAESSAETSAAQPAESGQVKEIRRRLRYVDFLERKLNDLQSHPERLDLLARVLRGMPFDESTGAADTKSWHHRPGRTRSDGTTATLESLRRRRKQLQRELKEVDRTIDRLKSSAAETSSTK